MMNLKGWSLTPCAKRSLLWRMLSASQFLFSYTRNYHFYNRKGMHIFLTCRYSPVFSFPYFCSHGTCSSWGRRGAGIPQLAFWVQKLLFWQQGGCGQPPAPVTDPTPVTPQGCVSEQMAELVTSTSTRACPETGA